jgi:glutathione synthase
MNTFRFLWITDPWETLDHPRDTTLRLAEETLKLGDESYWCDLHSIRWESDGVKLDARKILKVGKGREAAAFQLEDASTFSPSDFDSLHYRTDPPVDLAYLHPLQLLLLGLPTSGRARSTKSPRAELVNRATALCLGNEKLEASALGDLMPATVASSRLQDLEDFGCTEGRAVLKPLHQAQSKGIELLDWRTDRAAKTSRASLKRATENFTRPILLQRYLPGIAQGETRLWFVDGKLLSQIRKLPMPDDFRVDMDRGSRLARTLLTAHEKKAAARIGRHLKSRGIRLAAVDLIDGFVTDFNFTSPGLIAQMEAVLGRNLARPIVTALKKSLPRA